jgi:succinate dehydrogenase / fumarate reductase cytochrome b subunit
MGGFVIGYIIAFILLGFHLNHAFQSAFQSMGWNHSRYMPFIKKVGLVISILIPLGFTIIPLVIYFSEAYSV